MSQKQNKIITKNREKPPITYGPQRLHYQYSAVLPSLHLTLVSILQGIAFGILLQGIPLLNIFNADLLKFLLHVYFYLPYITSSILILLIWKQFVQAAVFSIWPLSTYQAGLTYLIALIEILAFRTIALPVGQNNSFLSIGMISGWIIGIGFIGIVGGIIRLNNLVLEAKNDYESEDLADFAFDTERREGILYIFLGIIIIILGVLCNILTHTASYIIWIILILLFSFVGIVIVLDRKHRQDYLQKYVDNSDLKVSPHGVIRYEDGKGSEEDPSQALIEQVEILQTQVQALAKKIDTMQEQEQKPIQETQALKHSLFIQLATAISIPLVTGIITSLVKKLLKGD